MIRHVTVVAFATVLLAALLVAVPLGAGEAQGPGARMDYGEVISYFFVHPNDKKELIAKGIAIRVAKDAAMCFDAETLRWAAGWTGGFVDMTATCPALTGQGKGPAPLIGSVAFATHGGPGWAIGGAFSDPRPGASGDLPPTIGRYRGLYRHGAQTVIEYTIGATTVRELPGSFAVGSGTAFTRTIDIGKGPAQALLVCAVDGAKGEVGVGGEHSAGARSGSAETTLATLDGAATDAAGLTVAGAVKAPKGATWDLADGRVLLKLPALNAPAVFTIAVWSGAKTGLAAFAEALKAQPASVDPDTLCKGGAGSRWPALTTSGKLGADNGPFAVDSVGLPGGDALKSWMRLSGVDFFPDGRAAVCTFGGEVWLVSGLDQSLATVSWKRFATGLFEPLGLVVADGEVLVTCRDRIVRLHDLDGDGEADHYESFSSLGTTYNDYHDFVFDLQRDRAGNFYYVRGGNRVPADMPFHSSLIKVSKDGASHEILATGFRAPNGMSVGPDDQITVGDNQGHWTPASKINLVHKGGWYGYVAEPRVAANKDALAKHRDHFDPPLCWLPMKQDNSSGGQAWVPTGTWGPLAGHLLHLSYGQSALFTVAYEEVGGVPQGGAVRLPLHFDAGIMRGRFSPVDKALYLCGMKGWQTNAGLDGCLQRVRATGKRLHVPVSMHVTSNGIQLGFSGALDPASVTADAVKIEQWNYQWNAIYGSDDIKPSDGKKGRDVLEARAIRLGADGHTVSIDIPGIAPVMQMAITYKFATAEGAALNQEFDCTINVVPTK